MDDDDKRKLDRILKLAEENNEYVRKVRSSQKTSQMMKAIYWVVIIMFTVGGFYAIKPYLNTINGLYSSIGGSPTKGVSGFKMPDTKQLQDLLKEISPSNVPQ